MCKCWNPIEKGDVVKIKKPKIGLLILVLFVATWYLCYRGINHYYSSFSGVPKEIYSAGEIVAFGENYQNKGMCADGYEISVDGFEIVDYFEYLACNNFASDSIRATPEKVALVYITIYNKDSTRDGVMLTELSLHGIDNYVGMNRELLSLANPSLKGNTGIHLTAGEQYGLIIPFNLFKLHFGADTWKNISNYVFYLHITSFPIEIDIKVN